MSRVTVKVEGLSRVLKDLQNKAKEVQQEVALELDASALKMAEDAQTQAPTDMGVLKQGISHRKIDELNYEVVSQVSYSPFIEFGTKSKVKIPSGLQDVAAQFRGAKSEGDAKKMIYDWCKRKGIEEEAWYPIYRSVMVNGIAPKPFFFKQLAEERPKLIERLKKILK
ncbi:MAG: hypothetical protein ACTHMM_10085 [Agriterribacter sp.]